MRIRYASWICLPNPLIKQVMLRSPQTPSKKKHESHLEAFSHHLHTAVQLADVKEGRPAMSNRFLCSPNSLSLNPSVTRTPARGNPRGRPARLALGAPGALPFEVCLYSKIVISRGGRNFRGGPRAVDNYGARFRARAEEFLQERGAKKRGPTTITDPTTNKDNRVGVSLPSVT